MNLGYPDADKRVKRLLPDLFDDSRKKRRMSRVNKEKEVDSASNTNATSTGPNSPEYHENEDDIHFSTSNLLNEDDANFSHAKDFEIDNVNKENEALKKLITLETAKTDYLNNVIKTNDYNHVTQLNQIKDQNARLIIRRKRLKNIVIYLKKKSCEL